MNILEVLEGAYHQGNGVPLWVTLIPNYPYFR
jgi:hypothetical protein